MASNFNGTKKWLTDFAQQVALQSMADTTLEPMQLFPKMLSVTPNIARINSILERPEMQALSLKDKISQPLKTIEQKISALISSFTPYEKSATDVQSLGKKAQTMLTNYQKKSDELKQKAFKALESSFSDKQKILKPSLMALNNIALNPTSKPKLTSKEAKMFNEINKDFPYTANLGVDKKIYQQTMVQIARILTAKAYEPEKIHQTSINTELNLIFRPSPSTAWWKTFSELSVLQKAISPLSEQQKKNIELASKDAGALSQTASDIEQAFASISQVLMGVQNLTSEQWKDITEIAHHVADMKNNLNISYLDFALEANAQMERLNNNNSVNV